MHGGWRLLTRKPITDGNMGWITPWECGCETRNGALFLSVPEIESFAGFCDKINIYGRWDEFVVGDVHVDVQSTRSRYLELKNPRSETVRLADVHGVSILPGKDIDFGHVGSNTRCLSVQLRSFWDKRTNVEYNLNSNKFKNIEVLRLEILPVNQKQLATSHSRPPMYRNNIAAAITRNLHLPSWSSLRSLSLPAAAMQRFRENQDITKRAACCGRHIPEYHFPWLELCIQLDTLLITNWWTCLGCYEGKSNFQEEEDSQESPEDVDHSWTGGQSMVYALMESVPVRLTEFSMNAMFDEYDHPRWLRTVEKEIRGAFKPQVRVNYTHTVTRLPDRPWY